MTDVLKDLRLSMRCLGIREGDGNIDVRMYIFSAINLVMCANIVWFIGDRWHDLDDRIFGLKAIPFLLFFAAYLVQFIYCWDKFSPMMSLLDETSRERGRNVALCNRLECDMRRFNGFWLRMMAAYAATITIVPGASVVVKTYLQSQDFDDAIKDSLSLPFPFYYPKWAGRRLTTVLYFGAYVVHSSYAFYAAFFAHLANVTSLCAIAQLRYRLQLLRSNISFLDHPASNNQHSLKRFLKYFLTHHQETYRKLKTVDRGVRWIAASISTTASIYICMSIYIIVQKDQIVLKIQELVFLSVWAYDIFLFDISGEKVKSEDENLRNAMYECSWVNKPKWFKSALLTAMTRNTAAIDLKPFGMFALNLRSFVMTMNAAYSYYNLLRNSKTISTVSH